MPYIIVTPNQYIDYFEDNYFDLIGLEFEVAILRNLSYLSYKLKLDYYKRKVKIEEEKPLLYDNKEKCPENYWNGEWYEDKENHYYRCLVNKNHFPNEIRLQYISLYREVMIFIKSITDEHFILKPELLPKFRRTALREVFKGGRIYNDLYTFDDALSDRTELIDFTLIYAHFEEFVEKFEKYKLPDFQICYM